jgi:outer membrane immunogenic protein
VAKETRIGFAAGGGLEYGLAPNWSAAIEYNHFFNFESTLPFTIIGTGLPSRADTIHQDVDLVTVKVNYHFGGPIVVRY